MTTNELVQTDLLVKIIQLVLYVIFIKITLYLGILYNYMFDKVATKTI